MSANLMWEPAKRKAKSLPDALKFVLREKLGLGSERREFSHNDDCYLRGLRDGGVEGAQELLDIIEQHEIVEIWLEY